MTKETKSLSRREFAKGAALTAASALVSVRVFAEQQKPAPEAMKEEKQPEAPKLSPESEAEAELAYEMLMRKYGRRFTEEQKTDIKRLVRQQQSGLEKLRAFAVSNSDEPATVFQILRRNPNRKVNR